MAHSLQFFFFLKIRTSNSTLNLHKFITIQYFQNLKRMLLDLFIINKNFFTARNIAVVLPATKHLKFIGFSAVIVCSCDLKKKKITKNFIFLLRRILKKARFSLL